MPPSQCPVAALDPAGADVHGEADRLRAHGAAALVDLPGGIPAWVVTDHAELRGLLGDPRVSKDPRQHWPAWIDGEVPADWPLISWVGVDNMFTAYGPDHKRLRGLVSKAFTPRRVEALRPRVEEITAGLLDGLAAAPEGELDLRAEFTYPLPIAVITELFGVPAELRGELRRIVDEVFRTSATPEETAATAQAMGRFLAELIEAKRREPGDDLTSGLLAARDEEENRLSERELADTLILMIGAGHETTVNLLGQAVVALTTHPEQLAALRAGEIGWDDVVEETLRWQPALANVPLRFATTDIELGDGTVIGRGDAILASYAAANRDPGHYADPARFDARRGARDHLAFGFGQHFCLGAALARLEAHVALPALFDRFPKLELAVPADRLEPSESFISNGPRRLPVRLDG
ncbi:cytochrome P450 family protein [Saccharopolyspora sp. MS10]|uniref:cytochrome P450 family protein n=1 Tax=Saccharopolyspora sp. MS10 TaxID=3385973 RepID=UPI0039A045BB